MDSPKSRGETYSIRLKQVISATMSKTPKISAGFKQRDGKSRDRSSFQKGSHGSKGGARRDSNRRDGSFGRPSGDEIIRLYGIHSVKAAIENKERKLSKLLVTKNALQRLEVEGNARVKSITEIVEPRALDKLVGKDAVHQGVILECHPLAPLPLSELKDCKLVLVLDQVTDPHNVGAILRSCAAFDVGALITTSRNSARESGVLAKSASGALDILPHIEVRNLSKSMEELHFLGFQTIGLDSEGPEPLEDTFKGEKIALLLGAEGKGLREKTRETATDLARLDMPGVIKSLNVSNAAALSLYAAHRFLLK